MAKTQEELELERRARLATQQIDKAQLGEVLNRPKTFSTGPYTTTYPVGSTVSIADRVQQWAGKTQPDNMPKFGEGDVGFAIRKGGYSDTLPKTKEMVGNLRSQYPNASDTELSNMVVSGRLPPVASTSPTLEQQATAAANATDPRPRMPDADLRAMPTSIPSANTPGRAGRLLDVDGNTLSLEDRIGALKAAGGTPEQIAQLRESVAKQSSAKYANANLDYSTSGPVVNLKNVQNQLPNVTYNMPSTGQGVEGAKQIASGALSDRARYKSDIDDIEQIKGTVITGGPRAASPAIVEQQLRAQMVNDLIAKAQGGDRHALKTLVAVNGLRDVPMTPDTLRGMADARYNDVRSSLEPGNALAQRASQIASANNANANARKSGIEAQFLPEKTKAEIEQIKANADYLRGGKGKGKESKLPASVENAIYRAAHEDEIGADSYPTGKTIFNKNKYQSDIDMKRVELGLEPLYNVAKPDPKAKKLSIEEARKRAKEIADQRK